MSLEAEIIAYEAMLEELTRHHLGKFVVIKDNNLIGAFDTFETAAAVAVRAFGRGPYLIRQVGAPIVQLPASVLYNPSVATAL